MKRWTTWAEEVGSLLLSMLTARERAELRERGDFVDVLDGIEEREIGEAGA